METIEKKKSNRGGARVGAGRKKKDTKACGFMATPEVEEILDNLPIGKKSEYINKAIAYYAEREGYNL